MPVLERPSVCTFDCADTCSLTVTVNDGHIAKVRGSHASPYTEGVICSKVSTDMPAYVHGPDRLLHPLHRTGPKGRGSFERITWDAALTEVRARVGQVIEQYGPQAVLPFNYSGPHGLISMDSMSSRFFHKMGASLLYRRALCGGVRSEAWAGTYGLVPGVPPEFAAAAQLNVVWGNNATVAYLHLVRRIRRSMRAGGKLVAVDPKRTKIAAQADLHLQLRPGTDVLLAWAMAVEFERLGAIDTAFVAENVHGFDEYMVRAREWPVERAATECSLRAEDIRTAANWMAEADPLVLSPGVGLERSRTGAAASARRSRCRRCSASSTGATASCSAPATYSRRQRRNCSGRTWCRPARARSTSSTSASIWCATTSTRRSRRCSSTTTIPSSCILTRTACARALSARTCSWSASTWR